MGGVVLMLWLDIFFLFMKLQLKNWAGSRVQDYKGSLERNVICDRSFIHISVLWNASSDCLSQTHCNLGNNLTWVA